jgi:hypothetical protein
MSQKTTSGDPTRVLVGSSWNTHKFGEHLHSFYYFEIGSEVPRPDKFNLRVSPMIIDGVETGLPTVMFQFWTARRCRRPRMLVTEGRPRAAIRMATTEHLVGGRCRRFMNPAPESRQSSGHRWGPGNRLTQSRE